MADVKPKRSPLLSQLRQLLSLTKKGATPIKWPIVISVTLALFGTALILMFPFAFLPFMVLHFGYLEEDKGYYVGIIASSYFFGRIVGSFFWGWLSDKKGRRPVILINIALNIVFCPAFGFSSTLWLACLFRFLIGTMTGVVTCTKTVLYEISDNTNQAFSMSCIGVAWGMGIILGPALGGFLSSPATKYPAIFPPEGFFGQFPFLLPCLVVSFLNIFCFILVLIRLPETLHKKKDLSKTEKKDISLLEQEPVNDADLTRISTEMLKGEQENAMQSLDDIAMLFSAQDIEDTSLYKMKSQAYMSYLSHRHLNCAELSSHSKEDVGLNPALRHQGPMKRRMSLSAPNLAIRPRQEESPPKEVEGLLQADKKADSAKVDIGRDDDDDVSGKICCCRRSKAATNFILCRLLRMSDVRHCLFAYSIFSFCVIGYEEVLGIWASTEIRFDGLEFSTNQLGLLGMMVSVPVLFIQLFIFSKLEARFGIKKGMMVYVPVLFIQLFIFSKLEARFGIKKLVLGFSFMLVITSTMLPTLHLIYDKHALLWSCLFFILAPTRVGVMCVFTGIGMFINNSVTPAMAGSVNGLGLTVSAVTRTLAPIVGGSIYAWSITARLRYPFDVNCVFVLFGLCYAVTHIIVLFLPERLDKQHKRHTIVEEVRSMPSLHSEEGNPDGSVQDKNDCRDSKQRKNGLGDSKYRTASREENANEKGTEWCLKEGETVAIVERNVGEKDGREKSTAF
ncbi:uncharacterized protein LOC135499473 [Lineus longissimus]|uniref:uncharacterized protein LOC135499473 n=1 Tax=Lineus longissimus TaxID=88925 RepID=UPI00315DE3FD